MIAALWLLVALLAILLLFVRRIFLALNWRNLWAGRFMGIQEKWVSEDRNEAAIRCKMCGGKDNPTGIAKCSCGYILDMDLFANLKPRL